jgi:hypothetical protein
MCSGRVSSGMYPWTKIHPPGDRWKSNGPGVLCVLAAWREIIESCYDGKCHCQRDCRRSLSHPYDARAGLAGIRLRYGRGLRVVRQQQIPVVYEDVRIDTGFRADLIVGDKVIIDVKSVENLAPVHKKQLLTYSVSRTNVSACASIFMLRSLKTALPESSTASKTIPTHSPQAAKTPRSNASASPRDFKGGALRYI